MAFTAFKGGLLIPHLPRVFNINIGQSALNGATEKWAGIIRIPKSGTLDQFEFRGNQAGLEAASRVRLSFQDVSPADGFPDGTQDQFRDMAVGDFDAGRWQKPPGVMTSDGTDTGVKRVVTRGDLLACVVEYDVFVALDVVNVHHASLGTAPSADFAFPYMLEDVGAGYVKKLTQPRFGLKYSDGSFAELSPNVLPDTQLGFEPLFGSGSTPDEIGLRFRLPFPVKVGGAWAGLSDLGANADLVLYDSDGSSVLTSVSMDKDVISDSTDIVVFQHFPDEVALLVNTFYRLVLKPTTAANSVRIGSREVDTAALMNLLPGGDDFTWTQRTDAGAWSEILTKRPLLGIYATAFDSGVVGTVGGGFSRGMVT